MSNIYIYKIVNLETENVYIGIREIEGDIKTDRYKGENTILKKDLKKYGKKAFSTKILAEELTPEVANMFIKEYKKILKATVLEDIVEDKNKKLFYKKKSGGRKKVICLNTKQEFDSATEASEFYNLKSTSVSKACCNKDLFAGKDKKTGEKLKWMYLEEYKAIEEGKEYINTRQSNRNPNSTTTKRILCVNTNEEFDSIKDASLAYGVNASSICQCCGEFRRSAGKHPETNEPLLWKYIETKEV